MRHGALLPVVFIAEKSRELPFDISQSRVIFFDHTDLISAGRARQELEAQIAASLSVPPDNPISDGMRLGQLQTGNVEEQVLAVVMERLQRVSHTTEQIDERVRRTERREKLQRRVEELSNRKQIRLFDLPESEMGEAERDEIRAEATPLMPDEHAELRAQRAAERTRRESALDQVGD